MRASCAVVTQALREERRSQLEVLALMETTFVGDSQVPLMAPLLETSTEYSGRAAMWSTAEGAASGCPVTGGTADGDADETQTALRRELCTLQLPSYIRDNAELSEFAAAIVERRNVTQWPLFPVSGPAVCDGDAVCKPYPSRDQLPAPSENSFYGRAYHDYEHLRAVEGSWVHELDETVYNDFATLLLMAALGFHVDNNCSGAGSSECKRAMLSVLTAPSKKHPFCNGSLLLVGLPRAPDGTVDVERINDCNAQIGAGVTGMPAWRKGCDFFVGFEGDQAISIEAGNDGHMVASCGVDGARSRFADYSTQTYTDRLEWLSTTVPDDVRTALRTQTPTKLPTPCITELHREWLKLNPRGLSATLVLIPSDPSNTVPNATESVLLCVCVPCRLGFDRGRRSVVCTSL